MSTHIQMVVPGYAQSQWVPKCVGYVQGDPEASKSFDDYCDMIFDGLLNKWSTLGWGFALPEVSQTISLLRMADNLYFLAPNTSILTMMMEDVINAMRNANADVKMSSLTFMMCGPQQGETGTLVPRVHNKDYPVKQVISFQALGITINARAGNLTLIDYRLLRGEALITKHMVQLKSCKAWGPKMRFWCDVVCPSVMFALGVAHLDAQHLLKCQRWENKWLRRILGLRRRASLR